MTFGSVWIFCLLWVLWTYVILVVGGSLCCAGIFVNGVWKHVKQPHTTRVGVQYSIKDSVFEAGNHHFTEGKSPTKTKEK